MVILESQTKVQEQELVLTGVDARLAQEMADKVEDVEQRLDRECAEATDWFYQMPFPGARYYFYKETPSQ